MPYCLRGIRKCRSHLTFNLEPTVRHVAPRDHEHAVAGFRDCAPLRPVALEVGVVPLAVALEYDLTIQPCEVDAITPDLVLTNRRWNTCSTKQPCHLDFEERLTRQRRADVADHGANCCRAASAPSRQPVEH